jgi:hypothetical protein
MKIRANKTLLRSLEKMYFKETRRVLMKIRQPLMEQAKVSDPETLRMMARNLLQAQPMTDHLQKIWGNVGGQFGYEMDRRINEGKKAAKKSKSEYDAKWRAYAAQRSALKAKGILDTETEAINRVIDKVLDQSIRDGLSIPNTRNLMTDMLNDELVTIERYQAERIARTEVGSAYNTASFDAAQENAEGVKKEWLHSGIFSKGYRQNHVDFMGLGPVDMDYEFAPGLQFPQDENGDADEVINCRCTIIYDVGN